MIDDQVITFSRTFQRVWSKLLRDQPRYVLDSTWPSLGVVDLITYPLRGIDRLDRSQFELLQGATAYISELAYNCWNNFPDGLNVDLRFDAHSGEINLIARDGRFLKHGAQFTVSLTKTLLAIHHAPKNPFPFFEKSSREIDPDSNLISTFASGLVSGLCPYGEGSWREKTDSDMLPYMFTANAICSGSAAAYYTRVFPTETVGQSPRLYERQLILPPSMHREPFPGIRATVELARYLHGLSLSTEERTAVALNLAYSPDELISSAGYAVSVALSGAEPSMSLKLLGESKGKYKVELRPAIVLARKTFGMPHDFVLFLERGEYEKALPLALIEKRLGLLPLLRLNLRSLSNGQLLPLWQAIAWALPAPARFVIDQLTTKGISTTEIELQGIFLDISLGNLDRAESELSRFTNGHSISDPDELVSFLELKGVVQLQRQQLEAACATFRQALSLRTEEEDRYVSIGNYLAVALLMLGERESALDALDAVIKRDESSIPARANRISVLRDLGRIEEAKSELLRLSRLAPTDRRIFSALISGLAQDEGIAA